MIQTMIVAIVTIIVGVILLTSTANTVAINTNTGATGALGNVGATAATIYGLYNFLYALLGVGLIIAGFVVFFKGAGLVSGKR